MTNLEDTVTIQGKRIASLEGDVNTLKVDTSKLSLKAGPPRGASTRAFQYAMYVTVRT